MSDKVERSYILTMRTRGHQTVLLKATSAKEAEEKWRAGDGERVDLEIDWVGKPTIVRDGHWRKKKR